MQNIDEAGLCKVQDIFHEPSGGLNSANGGSSQSCTRHPVHENCFRGLFVSSFEFLTVRDSLRFFFGFGNHRYEPSLTVLAPTLTKTLRCSPFSGKILILQKVEIHLKATFETDTFTQ